MPESQDLLFGSVIETRESAALGCDGQQSFADPAATQQAQAQAKRFGDRLGDALPSQGGDLPGEFIGFRALDAQCHRPILPRLITFHKGVSRASPTVEPGGPPVSPGVAPRDAGWFHTTGHEGPQQGVGDALWKAAIAVNRNAAIPPAPGRSLPLCAAET